MSNRISMGRGRNRYVLGVVLAAAAAACAAPAGEGDGAAPSASLDGVSPRDWQTVDYEHLDLGVPPNASLDVGFLDSDTKADQDFGSNLEFFASDHSDEVLVPAGSGTTAFDVNGIAPQLASYFASTTATARHFWSYGLDRDRYRSITAYAPTRVKGGYRGHLDTFGTNGPMGLVLVQALGGDACRNDDHCAEMSGLSQAQAVAQGEFYYCGRVTLDQYKNPDIPKPQCFKKVQGSVPVMTTATNTFVSQTHPLSSSTSDISKFHTLGNLSRRSHERTAPNGGTVVVPGCASIWRNQVAYCLRVISPGGI